MAQHRKQPGKRIGSVAIVVHNENASAHRHITSCCQIAGRRPKWKSRALPKALYCFPADLLTLFDTVQPWPAICPLRVVEVMGELPMPPNTVDRLNQATQQCLASCYGSRDRIAALSSFLADLKAEGWLAADVELIKNAVSHILAEVVSGGMPQVATTVAIDR